MGVFQYSNPISGDRATQCEIFHKVRSFQRKLVTKHVRDMRAFTSFLA